MLKVYIKTLKKQHLAKNVLLVTIKTKRVLAVAKPVPMDIGVVGRGLRQQMKHVLVGQVLVPIAVRQDIIVGVELKPLVLQEVTALLVPPLRRDAVAEHIRPVVQVLVQIALAVNTRMEIIKLPAKHVQQVHGLLRVLADVLMQDAGI